MNRTIIIILVALLVMAGCGGAVWYFFLQAAPPPVDEQKKEQKASLDVPEFVDIENLSIPVIREGRVEKYITISVSLEMVNKDAKTLADEAFPRLKDAIFRDLYSYFSMQQPGNAGLNVGQVKSRLLWAAERAIGEGRIKQVIIQGAYERKGEFK